MCRAPETSSQCLLPLSLLHHPGRTDSPIFHAPAHLRLGMRRVEQPAKANTALAADSKPVELEAVYLQESIRSLLVYYIDITVIRCTCVDPRVCITCMYM